MGSALLDLIPFALGLAAPLLWYLARPATAKRGLSSLEGWLTRHDHAVNRGVLVVFGLVFTVKGLAGL